MVDEITILKEKLERANRRAAVAEARCQFYEQLIHRAGMIVKSHGLIADKMLKICVTLPNWAKNSLMQMVTDKEKGVIVTADDPSLQENWGEEYSGAGSGSAQGPVALTHSSAVHEDYGLVWDPQTNKYVVKEE